jgi:hypothetical protein
MTLHLRTPANQNLDQRRDDEVGGENRKTVGEGRRDQRRPIFSSLKEVCAGPKLGQQQGPPSSRLSSMVSSTRDGKDADGTMGAVTVSQ